MTVNRKQNYDLALKVPIRLTKTEKSSTKQKTIIYKNILLQISNYILSWCRRINLILLGSFTSFLNLILKENVMSRS